MFQFILILVYLKIDLPLFSRLTGKKVLFSRVHIQNIPRLIYFGGLLGEKILQEANIQNGWPKLEEKWLSFAVFEHIRCWYSHLRLVGVLHLLEIQKQHHAFFTNIKAKK